MQTAWIIVGTASGIVLSLAAGLMTMSGTGPHVAACIAFFFSGSAIIAITIYWWITHPERNWSVHMRAGALSLLVLVTTPTMLYFAWPANAQTGNNAPITQQNNQGLPNINIPGSNNQLKFYQKSQGYNIPPDTKFGSIIAGTATYSATGLPGQTAPVIGGQNSVAVCPGQSAVGTYVPPGGHLEALATGSGGGRVTGYQSTVIVGGPNCH